MIYGKGDKKLEIQKLEVLQKQRESSNSFLNTLSNILYYINNIIR
jgi:hypothetical protein